MISRYCYIFTFSPEPKHILFLLYKIKLQEQNITDQTHQKQSKEIYTYERKNFLTQFEKVSHPNSKIKTLIRAMKIIPLRSAKMHLLKVI